MNIKTFIITSAIYILLSIILAYLMNKYFLKTDIKSIERLNAPLYIYDPKDPFNESKIKKTKKYIPSGCELNITSVYLGKYYELDNNYLIEKNRVINGYVIINI